MSGARNYRALAIQIAREAAQFHRLALEAERAGASSDAWTLRDSRDWSILYARALLSADREVTA